MVHIGADPRKTFGICFPHNAPQAAVKTGDRQYHQRHHRKEHRSMAREILNALVDAVMLVFVFVIFIFHGFAISQ